MGDTKPKSDSPPAVLTAAVHFLTVRLAGILPAARLEELRVWREEQLELTPSEPAMAARFQTRIRQRFFTEYDRLLDDCRDSELLADRRLAALIRRHLLARRPDYDLLAYSIMPNHVHLVLQTGGDSSDAAAGQPLDLERVPLRADEQSDFRSPLVDFLLRLKNDTAAEARQLLAEGQELAWHDESFDYWIRTPAELEAAVDYVAHNPVAAGLVRSAEQWTFSSAHERMLHDGTSTGWLPQPPPSCQE